MSAGKVIHVEEVLAGSELAVDVTGTGATTITVDDPTDFQPEGGELQIGGVEKGYASIDETTGVITLDAAIGTVYLAGEPVYTLPLSTERFAHAILEGDEETLQARIPHGLFDRLPVGARDGNIDELELVELSRDSLGELYVEDVLNREPVVDGTFLDPTTIPPPPTSDGSAPSTSPTPTIVGLIQSLFVTWVGIGNADLVTYEVHLSTSSGFTPSAGTYAGETVGTRFVIGTLPGTTNKPLPGTTYFVKLIAKDEDGAAAAGAEGSGTPATVNSPDITANAVIAGKIAANAVLAENLEAILSIVTRLVAGDVSGARLELGQLTAGDVGLAAFRQDGTQTFGIDASSGDVFASGEFEFGLGSALSSIGGTDFLELMEAPTGSFQTVAPVKSTSGGGVNAGGITSLIRSFASDVAAGNLILITWAGSSSGVVAAPATIEALDAAGSVVGGVTFTLLESTLFTYALPATMRQTAWAVENCPANIRKIRVTSGATKPQQGTLSCHEFSGVALASSVDKESSPMATGASTSPAATAPGANAQADTLSFGSITALDVGGIGFGQYSIPSLSSGYVVRTAAFATSDPLASTERLATFNIWKRETGVVTSSFTGTIAGGSPSTPQWIAYVVTFKAAASVQPAAPANHVRAYAKDVGGKSYMHHVDEAGRESAVVIGKAGEVWRWELVSVTKNLPSIAAHGAANDTITGITGLAVGDLVLFLDTDLATHRGFIVRAKPLCGTAGQIDLRIFNADTVALDAASDTYHFLVIHRT